MGSRRVGLDCATEQQQIFRAGENCVQFRPLIRFQVVSQAGVPAGIPFEVIPRPVMRPWHFCIGFLWSVVTLSTLPEAAEPPSVSAWLERSVVEFGGSVVINCTTNCQNPSSGGLETSLERKVVGEGQMWKAFRLNVSHWDLSPTCYFDCPGVGDLKPVRANITVYRLPTLVVLDPVPVIEVGENYTLTCRVSSVAPIRKLSVIFLQGGERLHRQTFEDNTEHEARDVVLNHTITARRPVYGEVISCYAVLDLQPDGPVFGKASSFNQTLNIMDYTAIYSAIASIATLALILVGVGIYSCCPRKQ